MGTLIWILMGLAAGVLYLLNEVFLQKEDETTLADILRYLALGMASGPIGLVIMCIVVIGYLLVLVHCFADDIVVIKRRKK